MLDDENLTPASPRDGEICLSLALKDALGRNNLERF